MPQTLPQLYILYRNSSSTESDNERSVHATSKNSSKNRDSIGSRKWSEKFDVSSRANEETDDYYGDLNYEASLAADEVSVCVMIMNACMPSFIHCTLSVYTFTLHTLMCVTGFGHACSGLSSLECSFFVFLASTQE